MAAEPKRRPTEDGDVNTGSQGLRRGSDPRRNSETESTAEKNDRARPNADTITEAQS